MPFSPCYNARMDTKNRQSAQYSPAASSPKRGFHVPAWAVVLVVAIVLIVLGIVQGDALDVWRKASLICYECIGIG